VAYGRIRPSKALFHGILLLNKPVGISSNRALRTAQRKLGADRAGHIGTLDPFASGMLPACFGEATKLASHFADAYKQYRATIALGTATTTGDPEGEICETRAVPKLSEAMVQHAAAQLIGHSEQMPPMYSAAKHNGQPLYRLARQGLTVERRLRAIHVQECRVEEIAHEHVTITLTVSKGTYIRELAQSFATSLGTVGHAHALRRNWVQPFEACAMVELTDFDAAGFELSSRRLRAADVLSVSAVIADSNLVRRLQQGLATRLTNQPDTPLCRVETDEGTVALARIESGILHVLRNFSSAI
jgi:tRNA pseudouridine55 synthase